MRSSSYAAYGEDQVTLGRVKSSFKPKPKPGAPAGTVTAIEVDAGGTELPVDEKRIKRLLPYGS